MSLSTLAEQIKANLADVETSKHEYTWQRGILYGQVRDQLKSNKAFEVVGLLHSAFTASA